MRIKKCISALKISLFMACLLPSLFFAQGARAEYYYWYMGHFDKKVSSPSAGCDLYFTGISRDPGRVFVMEPSSNPSEAGKVFYCVVRSGDWVLFNTTVILKGDRCPEGQSLDLKDGLCKPPPPECESGVPNLFRSSNYPIIVINGKNTVPSSPPSGCLNGCAYEADSSRPTSCYRTPGSTTEGFCNYTLKSNGQNCSADSGNLGGTGPSLSEPNQPPVTDPPSDPNDPGCPKGYSWSGTTCVKTPTDPTDPTDPKDPGGDGGGTGGGDGGGTGGGTGGGGDGGT
ncbi:TPA: attachment protein, partial [Pseudomonas aeruginosa]